MQAQSSQHTVKYLIGNWKANKTVEEAKSWIQIIKATPIPTNKKLKIILCPSFIHLTLFKEELPELTLGCQDISPYADGAYTGEVTARMVKDLVEYVILGHSERRSYFDDTIQKVVLKTIQAVDNSLTPIISVDKDNWRKQLVAIEQPILKRSIVMYEPPEAISEQTGPIGKGEPAPIDEVVEMIKTIKKEFDLKTVIYGGSIKSRNIREFISHASIDGVLPGSASLNPQEWIKMIREASEALVS
jgi:triosephosphate isomerase